MGYLSHMGGLEKVWMEKLNQALPDTTFEKIWYSDLLKMTDVKQIIAYPQVRAFAETVQEHFPDADFHYIDEF